MSTTAITDPRARFWGNVAKWGILLPIGFLVAPFIWVAIGGLLGLLAGAAILTGTWMLRPVVFSAAANMRLKLIKAEASRNPVETLQEDLRKKMLALDERKTAIGKLDGQIRTFSDKVDAIRAKYGPDDGGFKKLNSDLSNLRLILADRRQKWKQAFAQLERYEEVIERANMIWDAAQAAVAAKESSGLTEDDFYAQLRATTALDAIQNGYNEALADLDTSMLEDSAPNAFAPPVIKQAEQVR